MRDYVFNRCKNNIINFIKTDNDIYIIILLIILIILLLNK